MSTSQVKQHVVVGSQILAPLAHLGEIISLRAEPPRALGRPGLSRQDLRATRFRWAPGSLGAAEIYDALTTSPALPGEDAARRGVSSGCGTWRAR